MHCSRMGDGTPITCPSTYQKRTGQPLSMAREQESPEFIRGECQLNRMFSLLREKSANPIEDQLALWRIVVFNYLVGNTDNHLKNTSLLYSADLLSIRLAPAYDIICTQLYGSSTDEMGVSINSKISINEVSREDFIKEAAADGISGAIFIKEMDRMNDEFKPCLLEAAQELRGLFGDDVTKLAKGILDGKRRLH